LKKIFLLGSTGSIGKSTLEVVRAHPDKFRISVLVSNQNIKLLFEQIQQFTPEYAVIYDYEAYKQSTEIRKSGKTSIKFGSEGLDEVLHICRPDIFLNAFVGFAGLRPTIQAIQNGSAIALANKETLVVAGQLIKTLLQRHQVQLLPIDSEHSAIWQCLRGEEHNEIKRIILTASGGPFRKTDRMQLRDVTPEQALAHPNWKMGAKITIDSATLMNKGLEVIEAHWLYNVPAEKIEVVIHPQSIIHSMVEFADQSIKAQLGVPDMKIPIQYALSYPERLAMKHLELNLYQHGTLTFESPDFEKFPCLALAYQALKAAKTYPAAMNAANEIAVAAFLGHEIGFPDIPHIIETVLAAHQAQEIHTLDDCISADQQARKSAREIIARKQNVKN
jgi:1-deoxy-D-xylulose-5-phosphate reductoisomerase